MNALKQWYCPTGHVVGMVQEDAQGYPRLAVYRHAVDLDAEEPAEVDVATLALGSAVGVCDVDGCSMPWKWRASVQAVIGLALQLDPRQALEFGERWVRMDRG
jgi:hypothetical protein